MRLDRRNLVLHLTWGGPACAAVLGLSLWYFSESYQAGVLLRGGSRPGLVCGLVAAGIIVFEMLLWPRKYFRAWRLIAAKHWLAAHLWLGLISLPLGWIHSGFHTGGLLPTLLLILFTLTIVSGLIGWLLQHILPRLMLKQVTSETIHSQIDQVSEHNFADAYAMLVSTLGAPKNGAVRFKDVESTRQAEEPVADEEYRAKRKTTVVVGAVRDVGRVRGRMQRTVTLTANPKYADRLWEVLEQLEDYLRRGERSRNQLADAPRSNAYFAALRRECGADCHEVINMLEQYCDQRRQFDLQKKLTRWLHGWLPIHIGLSIAVTVLLLGHIVTAWRY